MKQLVLITPSSQPVKIQDRKLSPKLLLMVLALGLLALTVGCDNYPNRHRVGDTIQDDIRKAGKETRQAIDKTGKKLAPHVGQPEQNKGVKKTGSDLYQ